MIFSARSCMATDSSMLMLVGRTIWMMREPSSSWGTNSAPSRWNSQTEPPSVAKVIASSAMRWRNPQRNTGS
jgi:hypothetical protein